MALEILNSKIDLKEYSLSDKYSLVESLLDTLVQVDALSLIQINNLSYIIHSLPPDFAVSVLNNLKIKNPKVFQLIEQGEILV